MLPDVLARITAFPLVLPLLNTWFSSHPQLSPGVFFLRLSDALRTLLYQMFLFYRCSVGFVVYSGYALILWSFASHPPPYSSLLLFLLLSVFPLINHIMLFMHTTFSFLFFLLACSNPNTALGVHKLL